MKKMTGFVLIALLLCSLMPSEAASGASDLQKIDGLIQEPLHVWAAPLTSSAPCSFREPSCRKEPLIRAAPSICHTEHWCFCAILCFMNCWVGFFFPRFFSLSLPLWAEVWPRTFFTILSVQYGEVSQSLHELWASSTHLYPPLSCKENYEMEAFLSSLGRDLWAFYKKNKYFPIMLVMFPPRDWDGGKSVSQKANVIASSE